MRFYAPQSGHVIYLWMHKAKRINCIMHRGQNSTCSGKLLLLVSTFAIRREISGAGERGKVIITQKCVHKVCYFIIIFLCWTGEDSPNIEATVILISSASTSSSSNWFQAIHPSHLADLKCISKISSQTKVKLCTCMDG